MASKTTNTYSGFDLSIGLSFNEGWNRADHPRPAPFEKVCSNCKQAGHCHIWDLERVVNAFGNLIRQTREIIECRNCLNEEILGSMDFPIGKNNKSKTPRKFNLRKLTREQRETIFRLMDASLKIDEEEKEEKK